MELAATFLEFLRDRGQASSSAERAASESPGTEAASSVESE
jgi:hypothetical protein